MHYIYCGVIKTVVLTKQWETKKEETRFLFLVYEKHQWPRGAGGDKRRDERRDGNGPGETIKRYVVVYYSKANEYEHTTVRADKTDIKLTQNNYGEI